MFYSYEEAYAASLSYFDGDELAASTFLSKYALCDSDGNLLEKTPDDMHRRLAKEFARIESKKFVAPLSENQIFDLLQGFKKFVPQGSPMFGIGNPYKITSLSNCFLLESPLDCYNSILDIDKQLVNISKRRGGTGIDLSNLRPKGAVTKNAAKTSTGLLTWMTRYSNSTREVGQNARRGATMLTCSVHHPEIESFITAKNDDQSVTGANISVRLTQEFMDAVNAGETYEQRFPVDYKELGVKPIISKQVDATRIWNMIIHNSWLRAEPGLLMWDNAKYCPADSYPRFKSKGTNPCSEIWLSELDSCRLLAINLFGYVVKPFEDNAYFDFDAFDDDAKLAQRLMDDMVDLEAEKIESIIAKIDSDPEPDDVKQPERKMWEKILANNNEGRRTGTGITALGDVLAALGIRYGSSESVKFVDKLYRHLKLSCYRSSVDMAKEIGPFKEWNHEQEKDNPFLLRIKDESPELWDDMKLYGRRNIALLTTAPTGTVSIMTQTTSGIEPLFDFCYIRRKKINHADENVRVDFVDATGDKWQEFIVWHPRLLQFFKTRNIDYKTIKSSDIPALSKKLPWVKAEDISWRERVDILSVATKHVCHSISITVNLPTDVKEDVIANIFKSAFNEGCKGITVYRDKCRSGVLLKSEDSNQSTINKTIAPKRPTKLPCEVFHPTFRGKRYFVAVGVLGNDPYEVFAGLNDDGQGDIIVPKSIKFGFITKHKTKHYVLSNDEKEWSCNITNGHSDDTVDALTRMISTALRHGADISFIVHQLEKTEGDLMSFAKILARTLKKYIPNGTKVSGEICPECGSDHLAREDGCVKCQSCGWTKCA